MDRHIRAKDLVQYALDAVGGGYVYGSSGQKCTLALRESCAAANPSQKENILVISAKWDGKTVWDCSGLFRGAWRALWQYRSGGATGIWNSWCSGARGTISSLPNVAGIALFGQSKTDPSVMNHIGLTVGNGMAADAYGCREGVLFRPVSAHPWTHWAYLDDVDYDNALSPVIDLPALWTGTVRTKTGGGISLWTSPAKTAAVTKVPDGAAVAVLGDPDGKGFAQARYGGKTGLADLQYVIPPEGEIPAQNTYPARVVDVNTGLNLRTSPDMGVNTILLLPPGAEVEVFPAMASGAFSYVRYLAKTGYATTAHLRQIAAGAA